MHATDRLVLPEGLLLFPVEELSPEERSRLDDVSGAWVVSRPRWRGRSLLVDADAAALLEGFRAPASVVEAVLRHARLSGGDPLAILDGALPLLLRLRSMGLLATDGSAGGEAIRPAFSPGDGVGGYRLASCVHLFHDVEVYRAEDSAGAAVALKILRGGGDRARARLAREARILRLLAGRHAPDLLGEGEHEGRRFLATRWCSGVDAAEAGDRLRGKGDRTAVLDLCVRMVRAYGALHERGVVHGDVHPGNIRIGRDGSVVLLDFGLARDRASETLPGRGGIAEYMDPELCIAAAKGASPPPPSERAEQYSLAALCFRLLTGAHYLAFSLERSTWLRQVREVAPRSFADCGCEPFPAVEAVLARALRKEAAERFESVAALATALERAARGRAPAERASPAAELLDRVLERYTPAPRVPAELLAPPVASINYGAAGAAYFFYRLACLRGDPELLSAADLWACWAREHAGDADAFHADELGITPERVGALSLYHSPVGVHWVQALIAQAMGDPYSATNAVRRFVAESGRPTSELDLGFGLSGLLVGYAGLAEALPDLPEEERQALSAGGERTLRRVAAALEGEVVRAPGRVKWLGVAHGWAGILFAALRWHEAGGSEWPRLAERLEELADAGWYDGSEAAWPLRADAARGRSPALGWCHGSAGYCHLWLLAHRLYGEERYLRLALGAGRHVWRGAEDGAQRNGSLCCGRAGEGYALMALHRHTGEEAWLHRAAALAERAAPAARLTERRASLYKGDLGPALLAEELNRPRLACTPVFEAEPWGMQR